MILGCSSTGTPTEKEVNIDSTKIAQGDWNSTVLIAHEDARQMSCDIASLMSAMVNPRFYTLQFGWRCSTLVWIQ
eukprot:3125701-Amphidinium_carterae.1